MVIVESWASQADLDRHLALPWFAEWGPKLEAAQATPLVVRLFTDA
jgi:quinol monooxygenase YgiN